ncbi:MAG: ABC transporter substrate-binding protein [Mariprofundaceae bacterium]
MSYLHRILLSFLWVIFCPITLYAATNTGSAPSDVRIQLKWLHQFQFAGYYMAVEKGYYQKYGFNVLLFDRKEGNEPVQALKHKHADYAVTDSSAMISREKSLKVKVIATIFQHSPWVLMSRSDLNIEQADNMRGKRIMFNSGEQMAEMNAALQRAGLETSDYIRLNTMHHIDDLVTGKTDAFGAYSTNEPFYFEEHGMGYHLFKPIDYGIDFYGDVLITTDAEIAAYPGRVQAIRQATIEGWEYALSHIEESVAVIEAKYNDQHKTHAHLIYEAHAIKALMMPKFIDVGSMSKKRWQAIADVYKQQGFLTKDFQLDDFIYHPKPSFWATVQLNQNKILSYIFALLGLFILLHFLYLRSSIRQKTEDLLKSNSLLNKEVAERREAEAELYHAKQKAEQSNAAKSEFLAVMSHELRTPIHGIIGTLDMLKECKLDAESSMNLHFAQSASKSLKVLVNDILDLSKIESGAMSLNIAPFQLQECIDDSLSPFILKAKEKNIELDAFFEQVPSTIYGDVARIRQVLINMVGNAIKFTEHGRVDLNISCDKTHIKFAIKDTGIGISVIDQKLVFEPFHQAEALINRKYDGTGLGITISKRFATLMGGDLQLKSTLGKGSEFILSFPCQMVGEALSGAWLAGFSDQNIASQEDSDLPAKAWHVLLAEDDMISRRIAEKRLKKAGCSSSLAESGMQAKELFEQACEQNKKYDIILLDIRMPGMSGIEVARYIRQFEVKHGVRTPILGLSAHATEEIQQQCIEAGMDGFLMKPVEPKLIISAIEDLLQKSSKAHG